MTITVNLDFGKREIENFQELVRTIHGTVLQLGREIAVKALESMDEQLSNCAGAQRSAEDSLSRSAAFLREPLVFPRRQPEGNPGMVGSQRH